MSKWNLGLSIVLIPVITIVLIVTLSLVYQEFQKNIPDENHCLKEESYYYRIEKGFIFSDKIRTTEDKADGLDWDCLEWEYPITLAGAFGGTDLVWEKGEVGR